MSDKCIRRLDGILMACEGNIVANLGDWKTWDGITATLLLDAIERIYGKLWTRHTSNYNLREARRISAEQPHGQLWDSYFIRELVLSAKDTGVLHTRQGAGRWGKE